VRYRIWAKRNENESVVEGRCGHGDDPPRGVNLRRPGLYRAVPAPSSGPRRHACIESGITAEACRAR
jgi:hypothetical protein